MPSMQEIENFVAEVERNTARARQRAGTWTATNVVVAIAGNLGQVVVNGYGALRAIELDPNALRLTNERTLASSVLDAVNRAEKKAENIRSAEHCSLM